MDLSGNWVRLRRGAGRGARMGDEALLDALRKGTEFFEAVVPEDLPPAWMKGALGMPDGIECDCC
jgi:hypothetical protein